MPATLETDVEMINAQNLESLSRHLPNMKEKVITHPHQNIDTISLAKNLLQPQYMNKASSTPSVPLKTYNIQPESKITKALSGQPTKVTPATIFITNREPARPI